MVAVFTSSATLLLALPTVLVLSPVDARSKYIARVPNGAKVTGFPAIGHITTSGGGARNAFGLAFEAAGYQWTAALCALDSDGDGQTNGQEMGDPCCEWIAVSNEVVRYSTGVSHPGDDSLKADASLWTSIKCSTPSTSVTLTPTPTTNTTAATTNTTGSTNSTNTTTITTNTTAANGAAGQLPSAVGMGVTALLFAVTAAFAVA